MVAVILTLTTEYGSHCYVSVSIFFQPWCLSGNCYCLWINFNYGSRGIIIILNAGILIVLYKRKNSLRCFCSSCISSFLINVHRESIFEVVLIVNSICQLVKLCCQNMKSRNRRECLTKHSTYQVVIAEKQLPSEIYVKLFWWFENLRSDPKD